MGNQPNYSSSRAVYLIRLRIVFVTKYRRKVLSGEMLEYLRAAFTEILSGWRCGLIEFGGEADHVHLLIDIHPALDISQLINNLKSASSKRLRRVYADRIKRYYWKPVLWHRAYYAGSVGNVTLEVIRKYVDQQGTTEKTERQPNPSA